jgi:hypothetical protein
MENKPYNQIIGSSAAPYENQLANQCGLATNYSAVAHPSLPNYIAATSGSTQGITDDNPPSSHPLSANSIFGQISNSGSFQESMPSKCDLTDSYPYAVKHNPEAYYTSVRTACAANDVALGGFNPNALPAFSFVTPNMCNDTHDCSVATGDAWLQNFLPGLLNSSDYQAGKTVVFLTWDEDDSSANNHVATIVLSPYTAAGTQSGTAFTHYSLLRTTEELLGQTTFLGNAASAASMGTAFHLEGAAAPPPPPPPSSGTLFWSSDFEAGDLGAFGGVHVGLPTWGNSLATVVPQGGQINGLNNDGPWFAPSPQHGSFSAGLLTDGPASAIGSAGGQRAELTTGYLDNVNTERWYGMCVYIPSVPNQATGIQDNALWESGWGTGLNFRISGHNDNSGDSDSFQFANSQGTAAQKNGWSAAWYHVAPIVYDQWTCFTIHVFWSTGSTGFFEIYENGHLLTLTGVSYPFSGTRVSAPNFGVPNQMDSEFDLYRDPQTYPNLLYFDSLKIGDTYAIVQPG